MIWEHSVQLSVQGFFFSGWVGVFSLILTLPLRLHLSLQCQQICQNICGCYGDRYKEMTGLLLE